MLINQTNFGKAFISRNQSLHDLDLIYSIWFRYKMQRNVGFVVKIAKSGLFFLSQVDKVIM